MQHVARAFLVLGAAIGSALGVEAPVVRIEEHVQAGTEILLLRDLCGGLPEGLGAIRLGYAPYPGHHRWIERSEIEGALRRTGVEKFLLEMPDRVLVTREAVVVSSAQVQQAVDRYLRQTYPGLEIELQEVALPADLLLPSKDATFEVDPSTRLRKIDGANLRIRVVAGGRTLRSYWVKLQGKARAQVVVASRDLGYKTELGIGDVRLETRELEDLEDYMTGLESVLGLCTRKALQTGAVLRASDVQELQLVKRGDLVTLVGRTPSLTVTATARAKDSGSLGDWVVVQNLASKQLVEARVVDAGTVEVRIQETNR